METNELFSLSQAKNSLAKEYICLKQQMQGENTDDKNISLNHDPVYDLVDKQYLFIQV